MSAKNSSCKKMQDFNQDTPGQRRCRMQEYFWETALKRVLVRALAGLKLTILSDTSEAPKPPKAAEKQPGETPRAAHRLGYLDPSTGVPLASLTGDFPRQYHCGADLWKARERVAKTRFFRLRPYLPVFGRASTHCTNALTSQLDTHPRFSCFNLDIA